ncbi:MAG: hypothetical protein HQK76_14905 [Desulfobacterales bacterium]|nr:hypothetical protein [Desulfobacterales bacterium]
MSDEFIGEEDFLKALKEIKIDKIVDYIPQILKLSKNEISKNIKKLSKLTDTEIIGEEDFVEALETQVGKGKIDKYKSKILELSCNSIPQNINNLGKLIGDEIIGEEDFVEALETQVGKGKIGKYKSKILKLSNNGIDEDINNKLKKMIDKKVEVIGEDSFIKSLKEQIGEYKIGIYIKQILNYSKIKTNRYGDYLMNNLMNELTNKKEALSSKKTDIIEITDRLENENNDNYHMVYDNDLLYMFNTTQNIIYEIKIEQRITD